MLRLCYRIVAGLPYILTQRMKNATTIKSFLDKLIAILSGLPWPKVLSDVRKIIPDLLGAERSQAELKAPVRWRKLDRGGRTVVIAVNTDAKARIPFAPPAPEGKTLQRFDGVLSDHLAPLEAAIYLAE